MSRVGWWLLAAITLVFVAMVAAIFWRPDKWTGLVLVGLFGIYVGEMLIVGTSAFVISALVRAKRAADRAEQAASDA